MYLCLQKASKSLAGTQATQKNDLSRKFDQKANLQNVALSEDDLIQNLPCTIYRYFLKVKHDKTEIQKTH